MSYILDALRRLEHEKDQPPRSVNPVEAVLTPDPYPETRRGRGWALWAAGAAAVLLLAVLVTYRVARRSALVPAEPARASTASISASALPEPAPAPRPPAAATRRHEPLRPARAAGAGVGVPAREGGDRPFPPPEPAPRESVAAYRPPSGSLGALRDAPPVAPAERATRQVRPPPAPDREEIYRESWVEGEAPFEEEAFPEPSPETFGTAPPLEEAPAEDHAEEAYAEWRDEGVKISAIAWNPDPAGRFAIVNLKTVREGDEVAGYVVYRIHEDGIVFEVDGDRGKVFLGQR